METKEIILSSSGLCNIVQTSFDSEKEFSFIFGDKTTIKMNTIFAEFISPIVANNRRIDPTVESFNFESSYRTKESDYDEFIKEILSKDTLSLFKQISTGSAININGEQAFKLRFLSIIIGNEELFSKLSQVFPSDFNEDNVNLYLKHIQCCYHFSKLKPEFNFSVVLDYLSKNFFSINQEDLLKLPNSMLYSIISSKHLKLQNEDSLFEFIQKIFSKDRKTTEEDNLDIISFYEKIDYRFLSKEKFLELFAHFDLNDLTNSMWKDLLQCFSGEMKPVKRNKERYAKPENLYSYDGNPQNALKGIIYYLTEECGGNVHDRGVVKITASSIFSDHGFDRNPQNAADFNNDDNRHIFTSKYDSSAWIRYDFKDKRIHPTHYTIKSAKASGPDSGCPRSWRIEVSNNGSDWKVIDNKNSDLSLRNDYQIHTFTISGPIGEDESFRFIQMKQTGDNSQNRNLLNLSALEFFGSLEKNE